MDIPSPINLNQIEDAVDWSYEVNVKRPYRAKFINTIVDLLQKNASMSVLDLGSGPGLLAEEVLSRCPDIHYTAYDLSPAMHQLAKIRLGKLAQKVNFVEGSFKKKSWHKTIDQVDAIITLQAAHEVRHKNHTPTLFSYIFKLLKPDGIFLYCDHIVGPDAMQNNQLYMTLAEQQQVLENTGFEEIELLLQYGSLALWQGRR